MLKKLNWTNFNVETKNTIFSSTLLESALDIFWKEVVETKLSENQHIWLIFKLQWTNNNYVSIGKLVKLNKEDKDYLLDYISKNMFQKEEYYTEQSIKNMVFFYTIKKGRAKENFITDSIFTDLQYQNYQHHKLPITMNPLEYGRLIEETDNKYWVQVGRTNTAIINKFIGYNKVKFFKEGKLVYEFTDHKVDDSTFIRSLENKKFTFKENRLALIHTEKVVNFIKPLKPLNSISIEGPEKPIF